MNLPLSLIQAIAPNLGQALDSPFDGVARRYLMDRFSVNDDTEEEWNTFFEKPDHLRQLKSLDRSFAREMRRLGVDFSDDNRHVRSGVKNDLSPQIWISICFLIAYFLMLAAIFFVEVSDSLNMRKGENSLMGELQILFGVLTAGVGQILSFWFGGLIQKRRQSVKPVGALSRDRSANLALK